MRNLCRLFFLLSLLALGGARPAGAAIQSAAAEKTRIVPSGTGYLIANAHLTMTLAGPEEGYRIKAISPAFNPKANMITPGAGLGSIWRLSLADDKALLKMAVKSGDSETFASNPVPEPMDPASQIVATSLKAVGRIEALADGAVRLSLEWGKVPAAGGTLKVKATFTISSDSPFVRMRIAVENKSGLSLERIDFPYVSALGPFSADPRNDRLVWPRTSGKLIRNAYEKENDEAATRIYHYPSALQSMQVMALYGEGGGVYLAAQDPECWMKRFWYTPSGNRASADCFIQNFSAQMGKKNNGFKMPYDAVITVFRNDWWDVAEIYRGWALQQPWCPSATLKNNPKVPATVKNAVAWLKNRDAAIAKAVQEIHRLREGLGTGDLVFHWYGWNSKPFDTGYPELFPAKGGFLQAIPELRSKGITVMPYLNARVWDVGIDSWKQEHAEAAAVLSRNGKPVMEQYGGHTFTVMNPAAPLWQDKLASICAEMVDRFGVQGIYLDQVSAVGAPMDFRGTHSPHTGGGNAWASGYWRLLDRIHERLAGKDVFLTSESFTESYASRLNGGFLLWQSYGQDFIPLAQAVYGGRVNFWGRWFWGQDFNGEGYYAKLTDCLASGTQLGWLMYPLAEEQNQEQMAFARHLTLLYKTGLMDAFLDGHLVKPPSARGAEELLTTQWEILNRAAPVSQPGVRVAAWKLADGSIRLLVVNTTSASRTITLDPAGWQHTPPGGWKRAATIDAPEYRRVERKSVKEALTLSLPRHSGSVILLGP